MTVPYDDENPDVSDLGNFTVGPDAGDTDVIFDPIPVTIADEERDQAAHYGSFTSFLVPVSPQYVQLLARRPMRNVAAIRNPALMQPVTSENTGQVVGPAAGQSIASLALPAGEYTIAWTVGFGPGATASTDADNFQLQQGATVYEQSNNGSTPQTFYPQLPVTVIVPSGGGTVAVAAIAAGTGTATYRAGITATLVSMNTPVLLSNNIGSLQASPPTGYVLDSGSREESTSQQPLYASVPLGGSPITVSVRDEGYASDGKTST